FLPCKNKNNAIACGTTKVSHLLQTGLVKKLIYTALISTIRITFDMQQTRHANLGTLHPFRKLIYLLTCISCSIRHYYGQHRGGLISNFKFNSLKRFAIYFMLSL